jgi:hypothetical protein
MFHMESCRNVHFLQHAGKIAKFRRSFSFKLCFKFIASFHLPKLNIVANYDLKILHRLKNFLKKTKKVEPRRQRESERSICVCCTCILWEGRFCT